MECLDSFEVIGPKLLEFLNLSLPVGNIGGGHEVLKLDKNGVLDLDGLRDLLDVGLERRDFLNKERTKFTR